MNEPMALADRSFEPEATATPQESSAPCAELCGLQIFWNYLLDTSFILKYN